MIKYLSLFLFIFISCTSPTSVDFKENYSIEIDTRLEQDKNGFYFLNLERSSSSIQTIHRISGKILLDGQEPIIPQKVEWNSSHHWSLTDTAYVIIERKLNYLGEWVVTDSSFVTGFNGYTVPVINHSSYSGTNGEINTIFAPVICMIGDTVQVVLSFRDLQKTVDIILK